MSSSPLVGDATPSSRALLREALELLGTKRLALAMHDPSFPSHPEEDTGLGTPYSDGAEALLQAISELGFTALQLGPQGQTSAHNPSPYDGTLFARNSASLALAPLARTYPWLLSEAALRALVVEHEGPRADHDAGHRAVETVLLEVLPRFEALRGAGEAKARALALSVGRFRSRHEEWLRRTALFDQRAARHASGRPDDWPDPIDRLLWRGESASRRERQSLTLRHRQRIDDLALLQYLLHEQHEALLARCHGRGMEVYGDLQIGIPPREAWAYKELLLEGYRMGAPPSRTNPEGQPWGYPLLDPAQCGPAGAARAFVAARAAKLFAEYDALRIDHPHGWICPWAYRTDVADPLAAVQGGARLYSSPDLHHEHPALRPFALVDEEAIDRSLPRYHEHALRPLVDAEVERYGRLFDRLAEAAGEPSRLICEVLSTQPRPLGAVLARHGLGRFRVTQKANLDDEGDVYRTENAQANDWVMVGTHDTETIWARAEGWAERGELAEQAAYLQRRLRPADGADAPRLESPGAVAQAKLAELFVCDAENVMVFFADLVGETRRYNTPGTVGPHNWTLRLARSWREDYREAIAEGRALSMPRALAWASRARGGEERRALASKLEALDG